jgi:HSP20 family molecular chaperone IbpA
MNTTRLSLFDHPFFLGFDHFEREIDRIKKTSDGYPPYNVEQMGEDGLRITLAVAGFGMEDLDVELDKNQLTIRGKQEDDEDRIFLHRGIAARQFQRSFVLADGIEVKNAMMDNGMLHIDMQRKEPESSARKIDIQSSGQKAVTNGHSHHKAIDVSVEEKQSAKSVKKGK